MANLGFTVTAEDVAERNFDDAPSTPVPAGHYEAEIKKAELLQTKAGGYRVNVRYDILGPTHAKRVVFGSINIHHPEKEIVGEIGKQTLARIAKATGKAISDTDDLVGCKLKIHVKVTQSDQYGEGNDVDGWSRSDLAIPASAPTQQNAPKSGSTPPWLQGK